MEAKKVGIAYLPLHWGKAPPWLFKKMVMLGECIVKVIIDEYGREELLRRLADPCWFQAFACTLGWDFHSSGTTTVTAAVVKKIAKPEELGFAVAGGKGKFSRKTPEEIQILAEKFNLSTQKIENLIYASRMSAKVDNAAIQAGYPLYHHTFFFTEKGKYTIIQQGMNVEDQTARRYHWLSENIRSFVEEPHSAICCDVKKENVLDMTSRESKEAREVSVDLVKEGIRRVKNDLLSLRPIYQKSLSEFLPGKKRKEFVARVLTLPKNVNWKAVEEAYQLQPKNYEELLSIKGIGPATVRSLALISEIIYGKPPSWEDPKRFSFCLGGKDGVPYPVNLKRYSNVIRFLDETIKQAEIGRKEKLLALKRLSWFKSTIKER